MLPILPEGDGQRLSYRKDFLEVVGTDRWAVRARAFLFLGGRFGFFRWRFGMFRWRRTGKRQRKDAAAQRPYQHTAGDFLPRRGKPLDFICE